MLTLSPHRPRYIIGCDIAHGNDVHVTVGIIRKDGVIEYIIDRDEDNRNVTGRSNS